jgi:hypothetical protein
MGLLCLELPPQVSGDSLSAVDYYAPKSDACRSGLSTGTMDFCSDHRGLHRQLSDIMYDLLAIITYPFR